MPKSGGLLASIGMPWLHQVWQEKVCYVPSTDRDFCPVITCRGVQDRQQQQGADSYIGAIMDVSDADDGEVVEEDGMFDMVYTGHCNKQGCKEVRTQLCISTMLGMHLTGCMREASPALPHEHSTTWRNECCLILQ